MHYLPKKNFNEFYLLYLKEHSHPKCKLMHVIGSILTLMAIFAIIYTSKYVYLFVVPIIGYSFAWTGHFVFQKNKPLTFKQPLFSLMADYKMAFEFIFKKDKYE